MERLEALLQEFYGGGGDTQRQRAIEAELVQWRDSPGALAVAVQVLGLEDAAASAGNGGSSSPYLQYFSAMVLEESVRKRWHALGPAVHACCRHGLLRRLVAAEAGTTPPLEAFVASKLHKLVADVAMVGGWPQEWPTLLPEIRQLAQAPQSYRTGLAVLATLGVELAREDLPLPSARRREVRQAFTAELPSVVELLSALLTHAHEPAASAPEAAVQAQLACAALRCLAVLVEWPAMGPCLSPDLCANVFRVVQAATSSTSAESSAALGASGLAAVQVVTSILNKKLVHKQLEAFVMSVAMEVARVLEAILSPSRPGGLAALDESLLLALLEFLTVFLEQHLGRVLAFRQFPFRDFVRLLGQFTLALPSPQLLRRAFLPWVMLLEHLTESEAGLTALQESGGLLAAFAASLLEKLLFCTNAEALAELDDDDEEGGGNGNGGTRAEEDRDGGLAWEEEEEGDEDGPSSSLPHRGLMSSGWSGGLSERGEVIGEGVALLQSFARVPACGAELGGRVCTALGAALQAFFSSLEQQAHSSSSKSMAHTVADCTTLLALVLVVCPASPHEPFAGALRLVLHAAGRMAQARCYSHGAAFLRLQCAALVALRDLTRGLHDTSAQEPVEGGPPPASLDGAVLGELVLCARQVLDASCPEVLQREGAALLLALTQRLPGSLLRTIPAVGALAEDVYRLAGPLPFVVQERLLQAVSLLLLPNAAARPLPGHEDETALAEAYRRFLGPLTAALTQAQAAVTALPDGSTLPSESLLQLRRAARLLRGLCTLYAQTPKRTKAVLYGALLPGLPALLPCLTHGLGQLARSGGDSSQNGSSNGGSTAPAAAGSAAQSLLGLLLALHACFGKELGPTFLPEAIDRLTALFAKPGYTDAVAQQLATTAVTAPHGRACSHARGVSVFILTALLRLLRQLAADRACTPPGAVGPICRLALDRLSPLAQAAPADLLPSLLRLFQALLTEHWREFWSPAPSATAAGTAGPGANPLSALAAAAAAAAAANGDGSGGNSWGKRGGFVSGEMEEAFNAMLLVVYTALQDTTLPPGTVRLAIEMLQALDRAIGLFALPPFRASMRLPYALRVLELLLARTHPLLREELLGLLRAMTVAVDAGWLFETLFPQVLIKVEELTDEQRGALLASLPRDLSDAPTFSRAIDELLADIQYARMMNAAATAAANG